MTTVLSQLSLPSVLNRPLEVEEAEADLRTLAEAIDAFKVGAQSINGSLLIGPSQSSQASWIKLLTHLDNAGVEIAFNDEDGDHGAIRFGRIGEQDTPYWRAEGASYFAFDGQTRSLGYFSEDQAPGVDGQADAALVVNPDGPLGIVLGAFGGGSFTMLKLGPLKIRVADDGTTTIDGANVGFSILDYVDFSSGLSAANINVDQFRVSGHIDLPSYTVATLPVTTNPGRTVFCTNARNGAEGVGEGTGSIVVWSGSRWHLPGVATAVTA